MCLVRRVLSRGWRQRIHVPVTLQGTSSGFTEGLLSFLVPSPHHNSLGKGKKDSKSSMVEGQEPERVGVDPSSVISQLVSRKSRLNLLLQGTQDGMCSCVWERAWPEGSSCKHSLPCLGSFQWLPPGPLSGLSTAVCPLAPPQHGEEPGCSQVCWRKALVPFLVLCAQPHWLGKYLQGTPAHLLLTYCKQMLHFPETLLPTDVVVGRVEFP